MDLFLPLMQSAVMINGNMSSSSSKGYVLSDLSVDLTTLASFIRVLHSTSSMLSTLVLVSAVSGLA